MPSYKKRRSDYEARHGEPQESFSVREWLNKNPKIAIGVPAALLLVAIVAITLQLRGGGGNHTGVSGYAYFTTEDQLTGQDAVNALFVETVDHVPPFDHNGKPAYRAVVFTCNGGKNTWVEYLERYTPDALPKVQDAYAQNAARGSKLDPDLSGFEEHGLEIKKPGGAKWVNYQDPSFDSVTHVTPPDGVDTSDLNFKTP